jgi:hypothetical protein
MALQARDRVRSMTSIMSTTGRRDLPPAQPEAMLLLMIPPPTERDALIEHGLATQRVISSRGFDFDEERVSERIARAFDRSLHPQGNAAKPH